MGSGSKRGANAGFWQIVIRHESFVESFDWLLLRQAMQRAEAPDEVDGVDAHDGAAGEQVCQDPKGMTIAGIIECRHKYAIVGNVIFFSSRRRHTSCSRDWSSDVCSSD